MQAPCPALRPMPRRSFVLGAAGAAAVPWAGAAESLARSFHAWAAATRSPAANMAVTMRGAIVAEAGWGERAAGQRAPIWSLSKSITAACVAALADEGRLSLAAPIGRHLPELHPAMAARTAAELITHRSGLAGRSAFGALTPLVAAMLERRVPEQLGVGDLARGLRAVAPTAPAGAAFEYSNLNYLLLGQLIEAVSGEDYADACTARVLRPAGVRGAGLAPRWGRLVWSTGGWALSPAEYLAVAEAFATGGLGATAQAFMAAEGPEYRLGMNRRAQGMLFHDGSWTWRQPSASPPIHDEAGSQFRRWPGGLGFCATHAGVSMENAGTLFHALADAVGRYRGAIR